LFCRHTLFLFLIGANTPPDREIYYKRLTPVPSGASMYDLFYTTWGSAGNLLNVDFGLFSSYEDAVSGKNPWKFCNYNDPDVGFPRDCGPSGHVSYQWNTAQGSRHWAKPGPEKYQFAINKVQGLYINRQKSKRRCPYFIRGKNDSKME
jgi:hypothetical protein